MTDNEKELEARRKNIKDKVDSSRLCVLIWLDDDDMANASFAGQGNAYELVGLVKLFADSVNKVVAENSGIAIDCIEMIKLADEEESVKPTLN